MAATIPQAEEATPVCYRELQKVEIDPPLVSDHH